MRFTPLLGKQLKDDEVIEVLERSDAGAKAPMKKWPIMPAHGISF